MPVFYLRPSSTFRKNVGYVFLPPLGNGAEHRGPPAAVLYFKFSFELFTVQKLFSSL